MRYRILVLAIVLIVFNFAQAIDFKSYLVEIEKSREVWLKPSYKVDLSYDLFVKGTTKRIDHKKGVYKKTEEAYYYQLENTEIMQDQVSLNLIDKNEKILVVKDSKESKSEELLSFDLTSKACERVVKNEYSDRVHYQLILKGAVLKVYEQIEVIIDSKSFIPKKLILHYTEPILHMNSLNEETESFVRLEITYSNFNFNPQTIIPHTDYYEINNENRIVPNEAYSEFQFIDQRIY